MNLQKVCAKFIEGVKFQGRLSMEITLATFAIAHIAIQLVMIGIMVCILATKDE